MKRGDQDQESEGLFPLPAANIREQAAALADAAWIAAGFELATVPVETPTEQPEEPPA